MPGSDTGSDGVLLHGGGGEDALCCSVACDGEDASRAKGTGSAADCRGVLAGDLIVGFLGGDGGEGSEKQPSSCVICLFLANTPAWLLARVASL
jgi:hypothetical protein